jgi:hypothetical protein
MVRLHRHRPCRRETLFRSVNKYSLRITFLEGFVGMGQTLHCIPDQLHLSVEVAARDAQKQMHVQTRLFTTGQWAIQLFRRQPMYFLAGG